MFLRAPVGRIRLLEFRKSFERLNRSPIQILGQSYAIMAVNLQTQLKARLDVVVPIVVALTIIIFAATIAAYQRNADDARLAQKTHLVSSNFATNLQTRLDTRFKAGQILGKRFVEDGTVEEQDFRKEAALTHELYDDFQALNWVDAEGVIRIVTPEAGNFAALGLVLRSRPIPAIALARAQKTGAMQATPPIELAQGGRGFAAYLPVDGSSGRSGFVNIVFRSERLFDKVLGETDTRQYAVQVLDGQDVIFQSAQVPVRASLVQTNTVKVGDRGWQVLVAPTVAFSRQSSTWLDEAIFVFGLLAALFAGYSTRLIFLRQAEVRKTGALLLDIAENIEDAVWVASPDTGRKRYTNRAFDEIFGRSAKGRPADAGSVEIANVPDAMGKLRAVIEAAVAEKLSEEDETRDRFEIPILQVVDTQGAKRDLFVRLVAMRDDDGTIDRFVGVATDVSELLKAQERLRKSDERLFQAQKLEAVGQLTGGVAHDFNNLLQIIQGNAEIVQDVTTDPLSIEALDEIIGATQRGADLSKNMLAFAGKARLVPGAWDLNEIVREAQSWMVRALPESISVAVSLPTGLWPVLIDRTALEGALLNLMLNAKDAMEGRGKLTIETANVRIDTSYNSGRGEDLSCGRYVTLAVSDDGSGISKEDVARIFEPFFTTKEAGAGTGLGLSMVRGFIEQSGGAVRVYSELGQGTTFKIYIPVSHELPHSQVEVREGDAPALGRCNILLVEDEKEIRKVLNRHLSGAGFSVTQASNGDEALVCYGDGSRFDLVISDIVMPGSLQGPALAKQMRERKADQRFIFISGYASEAQVHGNGLSPADIRLTKPVLKTELLASVREALESGC